MFWKKSKWSETPGCFERHLQRRDGNVLFPLERRKVSREEIAEARRRDQIDQERFIEAVGNFVTVSNSSENAELLRTDSSTLQQVYGLLQEAASIGGNIQNEIRLLEATEDFIIKWLNTSMPKGKDLLETARSYSAIQRNPFMAQIKRKDTPILKDELIPTLLSEDFETISIIGLASRSFPGYRPCEADMSEHLGTAIRQGFSKERAQAIMNAWNRSK